jgi:hypothetical protein
MFYALYFNIYAWLNKSVSKIVRNLSYV